MNNYEKQAQDFLDKTQTTFKAEYIKTGFHFDSDKEERDIYKITLQRGNRKMVFNFGASLNDSQDWLIRKNIETKKIRKFPLNQFLTNGREYLSDKLLLNDLKEKQIFLEGKIIFEDEIIRRKTPTPYAVLACLQKYEVGSFENFCDEFGYNVDSRKAEKTYNAVAKEWQEVQKLWSDGEIALLQEIN